MSESLRGLCVAIGETGDAGALSLLLLCGRVGVGQDVSIGETWYSVSGLREGRICAIERESLAPAWLGLSPIV